MLASIVPGDHLRLLVFRVRSESIALAVPQPLLRAQLHLVFIAHLDLALGLACSAQAVTIASAARKTRFHAQLHLGATVQQDRQRQLDPSVL
jgi:hypothetical protein